MVLIFKPGWSIKYLILICTEPSTPKPQKIKARPSRLPPTEHFTSDDSDSGSYDGGKSLF